jgi:oligoendopeptidase F
MNLSERTLVRLIGVTLVLVLSGAVALAADSPVNWDLTEIYSSDEAWEEARKDLAGKTGALDGYKGKLGNSAGTLKEALEGMFAITMQASRLGGYAAMRRDEDLRESGPQAMNARLDIVYADLSAATDWIDPEILDLPKGTIARFMKEDPGLSISARYLERWKKDARTSWTQSLNSFWVLEVASPASETISARNFGTPKCPGKQSRCPMAPTSA